MRRIDINHTAITFHINFQQAWEVNWNLICNQTVQEFSEISFDSSRINQVNKQN